MVSFGRAINSACIARISDRGAAFLRLGGEFRGSVGTDGLGAFVGCLVNVLSYRKSGGGFGGIAGIRGRAWSALSATGARVEGL